MHILALYNIKGGVGKTASAVNLAGTAAMSGMRTLIWDLDSQGAATFYLRVKPKLKGGGEDLLKKRTDLRDYIKGTEHPNLDLLPADFSNRHLDLFLEELKDPARRMATRLEALEDDYDVVFLDCPPSVSRLSEAVVGASNALLVPMIPTTLCLNTLDKIYTLRESTRSGGCRILPFFTMVDRRKALHLEILQSLPEQRQGVLRTFIPSASEVERMGITQAPVPFTAPSGPLAGLYAALWAEILEHVQMER